jgi:hypothetical protein
MEQFSSTLTRPMQHAKCKNWANLNKSGDPPRSSPTSIASSIQHQKPQKTPFQTRPIRPVLKRTGTGNATVFYEEGVLHKPPLGSAQPKKPTAQQDPPLAVPDSVPGRKGYLRIMYGVLYARPRTLFLWRVRRRVRWVRDRGSIGCGLFLGWGFRNLTNRTGLWGVSWRWGMRSADTS